VAQISTLLIGGVVADRVPRRLVMVGSDTANCCIRVAMGAAAMIGMSTTLVVGAAWILVSTLAVIIVRDVRDFRLREVVRPEPAELAPATMPTT
jgi:hypothetical protein